MARILYTVNIPRFFLSHRLPLALAAVAAGHDVYVATSDADTEELERIRASGLILHPIPLAQHGTSVAGELRTLLSLIRLYRRVRPDLIHHVTIKPVLYGGLAARLTRVGAVVAALSGLGRAFPAAGRGLRDRALRTALRLALPPATTHLLLQNDEDRETLLGLALTTPTTSSVIRGSGVDAARFSVHPEPAESLPMVLFAGRLMREKGLPAFAEVARRLAGSARFVVVGYAEHSSPDAVPEEIVASWANDGLVEWWGARQDMPDVLSAAAIVVLPTSYGEGVPRILIEAAASGRPIVTTDIPGCRDICRHEVNGLLVAPNDLDALTSAVESLIADRARRREFGRAGRVHFEAAFTLEAITARTLALYDRLLDD